LDVSPLPPPTHSSLAQLKTELSKQMSKHVFKHCLGSTKLEEASDLANNMIVVCFDTESWMHEHSKLIAIGVATFDMCDMNALKDIDIHGENLLKQVYFYHVCIEENAHLVNIEYLVGDPES
jgi:hypothetical protein